MVDPILLGTIRAGFLLGQVGISAFREILAWAKANDVPLEDLEVILASIEESEKAADEATAALLDH